MKIVIIDNYDSFTYNISHLVKELGAEVTVLRNNCFRMEELEEFDKILLSPGPGIPEEAGLLLDVIRTYSGRKPILGVCLGEQAIGEVFGGKLVNLKEVYHGIQSKIRITANDYIFNGLPEEIAVGRYHSWVVDKETLPACFEILGIAIYRPVLLNISLFEALLVGSVLAAVSPAIVVPMMLKLMSENYGKK